MSDLANIANGAIEAHRMAALDLLAARPQSDWLLIDAVKEATSTDEIASLLAGKKKRKRNSPRYTNADADVQLEFDLQPTSMDDSVQPEAVRGSEVEVPLETAGTKAEIPIGADTSFTMGPMIGGALIVRRTRRPRQTVLRCARLSGLSTRCGADRANVACTFDSETGRIGPPHTGPPILIIVHTARLIGRRRSISGQLDRRELTKSTS